MSTNLGCGNVTFSGRLSNPLWSPQQQKAWLTQDDMKLHWVAAWSWDPHRLNRLNANRERTNRIP